MYERTNERTRERCRGTDKARERAKTERKKQIEIEIVKTNHTQQIRAHITVAHTTSDSIHNFHENINPYVRAYERRTRGNSNKVRTQNRALPEVGTKMLHLYMPRLYVCVCVQLSMLFLFFSHFRNFFILLFFCACFVRFLLHFYFFDSPFVHFNCTNGIYVSFAQHAHTYDAIHTIRMSDVSCAIVTLNDWLANTRQQSFTIGGPECDTVHVCVFASYSEDYPPILCISLIFSISIRLFMSVGRSEFERVPSFVEAAAVIAVGCRCYFCFCFCCCCCC